MGYLRHRQEAAALSALQAAAQQGSAAPSLPDALAHSLTGERLVEVDDFGTLRITERGRHHLQSLEKKGYLRHKPR